MSVEAKLSRLSLDLKTSTPNSSGTALNTLPQETPDSWDDPSLDDDGPVEAPGPSLKHISSNDSPGPPPPTPISPLDADVINRRWESEIGKPSSRYGAGEGSERRPEKTTATASRLIAGALGMKAPKKTDEQKQYEKAVKEAEIKRKAREKEQREQQRLEDEKVKAAVWDD